VLYEAAGKVVADANVSETAKVQKKIVRDRLTGEGRERAEGYAALHGVSDCQIRPQQGPADRHRLGAY
jgi:hypothetical protein